MTIGPGPGAEITITGIAAHIFSASPGGPRGQGGLSTDDLRSIQNAIWVCALHGNAIDKNKGARYAPELLLSFKALHEARVVRDQGGLAPQFYWVQEARFRTSPIVAPHSSLRFGKLTLIVGANESGKSVLCKWLAGFSDSRLLEAWDVLSGTEGPDLSVVCHTPSGSHQQRAIVRKTGSVEYWLDDKPVPVLSAPMRSLYVSDWTWTLQRARDSQDDIADIAQRLGLTPGMIQNLVAHVNHIGDKAVRNLRIEGDNRDRLLYGDVKGAKPGLRFSHLSNSEQVIVVVRLAAAYSNATAIAAPTMLLLDGGVSSLDTDNLLATAEFLLSDEQRFQSVVVLPTGRTFPRPWLGWEFVRLVGTRHDVRIEQEGY